MSEDQSAVLGNAPDEPFVNHTVLSGLFEFGDDGMRQDLCAQLLADFTRLAEGLNGAEPVIVASVAHELKGLSATIGAQRLADMAQTLHRAAESVSPSALAVLTYPVRTEIAEVLSILGTMQQRFSQ